MSSTESTPSQQVSNTEMEEENREEQGGQRLVLPEDGYEWRKYGQKFIKNIGKFRSYYKCQKQSCMAKKRVERSESEANNVRVVYDGAHNHASAEVHSASSQGSSSINQYNLLSQVLGDQAASSHSNPHHTH